MIEAAGQMFTRRFALGAAALIAATGVLGFFLWFRDSSLVRVEHVKITGLTTRDAPAIRRTLREAAQRMTTLHYDSGALNQAVEAFPAVESVSASADLPKTLRIEVREHRPVAALESPDGRRVAVAGDGTLLPRARRGPLPAVKVDAIPTRGRLGDTPEERLVVVLAGAPAQLRPLLDRAYRGPDGVRVAMRTGPILRFGAPQRIAAKWAAVTRVLADGSAGGAAALDVRLPERPAATFEDEAAPASADPALGGEPPAATATGATGAAGATGPQAPAGTTAAPAPEAAQPQP